ncbi:general secretion pathway protein GspB [uncultured Shewanella sp.]|uniref:general secretion pathway protein GspB n=1 Tax=uncultured Shewanella sp. TaxID=173975 RepID=UPI002617BEEE|nr:general secretion pathway protein GspB [uncultured Shewanella sp.]
MSILLDAVTRSKQQEAHIDPVLTPRLDLYAKPRRSPIVKKVIIFVMMIALSIVLAWVVKQALNPFGVNSAPSKLEMAVNDEETISKNMRLGSENTQEEKSPVTEVNQNEKATIAPVTFVGKAMLPVPQAQPLPQVQPISRVATLRQTDMPSSTVAENLPRPVTGKTLTIEAKSDMAAQAPIILGANSNQKGQDVLAALKKEVAIAASEVGLHEKPAQVNAQSKPKPVQATGASQTEARQTSTTVNTAADNEDSTLLIAKLQKELRQVEREHAQTPDPQASANTSTQASTQASFDAAKVPKYGQLPTAVQLQVPEFNINGHVYSSNVDKRWLNVDGIELQQGDKIQGKLKIIEIRPQDVVLEISGNKFSVPAA